MNASATTFALDADIARLRGVFDAMSEGFTLLSSNFILLDLNAEALRLDTRPRDELIGRSHWALYPGSETSPLGILYKRALAEKVQVSLKHEYRWNDGRVSWLDMRAFPTTDGCLAIFFRDVSERHFAQQKLRESSDRFEAAVRAFGGIVWTNDADGRMVGEQPGWATLTGQTFDDYQGYGWSKAVHPDDAQPTIDAWNEAVAAVKPFVFEHRVRQHDGAWRRFSVRAVPTINDDGTIREWVGVHRDVTDLRMSEIRFRQLAENIQSVFYVLESDEPRISYVSPAYEKIWQQSADELLRNPTSFMRDVHPDDLPRVQAAVEQQRKGENTETCYRLMLSGGGTRHIRDCSFATTNPDDDTRRIVGVAEDVTFETEARLRLASNAETFETLVQNSPFGIYVIDADFKVLHTSLGTLRVFSGISDLIGRDFEEVLHSIWPEPFAGELVRRFRHTLATGESYTTSKTIERRRTTDDIEAYDWRIDRITLPNGLFGVVCYYYDLTERIVLENQLKRALADKDMLLREIDHRVRNSLSMVAALLAMQSGSSSNAEVKQALAIAASRMHAVARIHERLYKGDQLGVVNFGTYLEEICGDLRASLHHGHMKFNLNRVAVALSVDRAIPLGLIVNELVTNAFKYAGDGATINVDLQADETKLTLIVADSGNGLPSTFDIHQQAGLGMRVIDLLVRQLGGSIDLPAAGAQARFTVVIPIGSVP